MQITNFAVTWGTNPDPLKSAKLMNTLAETATMKVESLDVPIEKTPIVDTFNSVNFSEYDLKDYAKEYPARNLVSEQFVLRMNDWQQSLARDMHLSQQRYKEGLFAIIAQNARDAYQAQKHVGILYTGKSYDRSA